MCFLFLGMPASMGTMSRSDSAFTMSSMTLGGRSESFTITLGAQMKAMHNLRYKCICYLIKTFGIEQKQ